MHNYKFNFIQPLCLGLLEIISYNQIQKEAKKRPTTGWTGLPIDPATRQPQRYSQFQIVILTSGILPQS